MPEADAPAAAAAADPAVAAASSEVPAVRVAAAPDPAESQKSTLDELREYCTWQNGLSCAFALGAGALAHDPKKAMRRLVKAYDEVETLGGAWEAVGVLVVFMLAINAIRVYTTVARQQLSAVGGSAGDSSTSTADGDGEAGGGGSAGKKSAATSGKAATKKTKKTNKRPKLEFIRK